MLANKINKIKKKYGLLAEQVDDEIQEHRKEEMKQQTRSTDKIKEWEKERAYLKEEIPRKKQRNKQANLGQWFIEWIGDYFYDGTQSVV